MSRLTDMLGSRYPIIHGPIGALNSPELVAAVSEAGGFGMLALGFIRSVDEVKRLVDQVRERTDKPFGANIMIMNPENRKFLQVLSDAGIKTVTTSVGSPSAVYPVIHDLGMKGLHVLLALKHAIKAEEAGADGLVIAGAEAGGFRSTGPESSTMVLVPMVCDHVKIPVVAAGGIADSRGYRAALALGAEGVQVGTGFLVCAESPAHENLKKAIVDCKDGGTALVPVKNLMMRAILTPELKRDLDDPDTDLSGRFNPDTAYRTWEKGDFSQMPAGAGAVSALINDIKPVKEIIEEMVSQ